MNTLTRPSASMVLEVAIIGAGFAGLGMAIRLKKAGITNFKVFDKGHDVGGTWRDNTYPGCGCDIKSTLYSFSYEPNPNWANVYSKQDEIYQYLRHCATKYAVYPFIQFNTLVVGAVFDAQAGEWAIELDGGEQVRAKNLVVAPGPFKDAATPYFKDIDSYTGVKIHTAYWDHSVNLAGKRVGMIGTGATAIQVAPAIVDQVNHLTVFQRTPNWIMPRPDRDLTEDEKLKYRQNPLTLKINRLSNYWLNEVSSPFLILKYDAFKKAPSALSSAYLKRKVKDPVLRAKLTPDYKFGCKRVLVSSDWYPTVQRQDVHLVTEPIAQFTKTGIKTVDGTEHALDVVILATGYEVRQIGSPFKILGLDGISLNEKWQNGAEAFQGIATSGFPNLYFLTGPFSGPGHTSVIAYAEVQIDYIWQAIELRMKRHLKYLSVKPAVEAAFVASMDRRSEHTVWKSGCANWYLSPNGRNNTLYPGSNIEYRLRVMRFNPAQYLLVNMDGHTKEASLRDHVTTGLMALSKR